MYYAKRLILVRTTIMDSCRSNTLQYIAETRDIFVQFDRDNDGFITVEDLKGAMLSLGKQVTDDELRQLISEVDLDGDGKVSFKEFLSMNTSTRMRKLHEDTELREAFDFYDANKDGLVSATELRNALRRLGMPVSQEEAVKMIKVADTDGDGQVSFEEFAVLMKNT